MKRVLVFDGDKGQQRFNLCRAALLQAGDGKGERNRDTVRREARLLDALDAASEPAPTETDKEARTVKTEPVPISQDDFALLEKYVDSTPWLPRVSREAVDAQDWLSAAEKIEG